MDTEIVTEGKVELEVPKLEKYKEEQAKAKERLKEYKDQIEWIKNFASQGSKKINEKLDFVYIDGNHEYESVKKDINNYYPLLKENGLLAGHDFDWKGVTRAVTEFSYNKNLKLNIDQNRKNWSSDWWIKKGEKWDKT